MPILKSIANLVRPVLGALRIGKEIGNVFWNRMLIGFKRERQAEKRANDVVSQAALFRVDNLNAVTQAFINSFKDACGANKTLAPAR